MRILQFAAVTAALFIAAGTLSAQGREFDVIYKKDGTTVVGTILERIPDKTVVIEVNGETEFVDYSEIRNIAREFFPEITDVVPRSGEPGTLVTVRGAFPKQRPSNGAVMLGKERVTPEQWKADAVSFRVPEDMDAGTVPVTVIAGNQKAAAKQPFFVKAKTETPVFSSPSSYDASSYDDLGGAIFGAYTMPSGSFGATEGNDAGYAQGGFGFGIEGRVRIAENFYIPIGTIASFNGLDLEAMNSSIGGTATVESESEMFTSIAIYAGLGLLVPLDDDVNLFVSGEAAFGFYELPDVTIRSTFFSSSVESETAFPFGFTWSAGLMFTDGTTLSYRMVIMKPNYELVGRELQSDYGAIVLGIGI